ncbi:MULTISPECIES: MFS transporter [unclassified Streptomyces]|uniref:MFS transporter n=1 Tax=unclassified Streptomyces TaxID=2593676 RepID=UPI00068B7F62|nr:MULTISPECIES: MFS transporter [unclassified Streptomyces]MCH0557063.1 MFS transporter [Streptomyces sp. MUM 16J]
MLEGAVLLGFLTYVAPALEDRGASATLAGAVSALYGVGSMAAAQMDQQLVGRWTPVRLIVVGGAQMAVAFGFAAASRSVPALVGCALLLGGGWSFMHSTIQSWATTLSPAARATSVAMLGGALYVGRALASAFTAGSAEHHAYQGMFLTAAVLTVPLDGGRSRGSRPSPEPIRPRRRKSEAGSHPTGPNGVRDPRFAAERSGKVQISGSLLLGSTYEILFELRKRSPKRILMTPDPRRWFVRDRAHGAESGRRRRADGECGASTPSVASCSTPSAPPRFLRTVPAS